MLLIWLLFSHGAVLLLPRGPPLNRNPSYTLALFQTVQPESPSFPFPSPLFFYIYSFDVSRATTNVGSVSGHLQSQLASSEDPWLVLASSTSISRGGKDLVNVSILTVISPLVPHWDGHRVSDHSMSLVPSVVEASSPALYMSLFLELRAARTYFYTSSMCSSSSTLRCSC